MFESETNEPEVICGRPKYSSDPSADPAFPTSDAKYQASPEVNISFWVWSYEGMSSMYKKHSEVEYR